MSDLQICRVCLQTEGKLYKMDSIWDRLPIQLYYVDILHKKVSLPDDLPHYFCYECASLLHKYHQFKRKCFNGFNTLKGFALRGEITYKAIKKLDRRKLDLTYLEVMKKTKRTKTFSINHPENNTITESSDTIDNLDSEPEIIDNIDTCEPEILNKIDTKSEELDTKSNIDNTEAKSEIIENLDTLQSEIIKVEQEAMDFFEEHSLPQTHMPSDEEIESPESPQFQTVNVSEETADDIIKNICNPKSNYVKEKFNEIKKRIHRKRRKLIRKRKICEDRDTNEVKYEDGLKDKLGYVRKYAKKKMHVLDASMWKIFTLSEEEAWASFRALAEDPKYIAAEHKCTKCYVWFRTPDKLKRHQVLKHGDRRGNKECIFCGARFIVDCHVRKHATIHYKRYECLKCVFRSRSESSALAHEAMHSNTKQQCPHCGASFKHLSTYYTHLRTHRSEHVCTLCGVSFVSAMGLRFHVSATHCTEDRGIESDDDHDTSVNTFCEKCAIRFETRAAYIEHVFQSTNHDDEGDVLRAEDVMKQSNKKKIMSLTQKEQIANKIKGITKVPDASVRGRSFKQSRVKPSRQKRKPTTCQQCGQSFETQLACMQHHRKEHPRTSFYPSAERIICEICGASLAPGSIIMHRNLHSRESIHTCETCGRSFHTQVGLRRHLVTHTGEKPFPCSACNKCFTQSNSMKLHYRTFHLKQPYPKRNRRKREPKDSDDAIIVAMDGKLNAFAAAPAHNSDNMGNCS